MITNQLLIYAENNPWMTAFMIFMMIVAYRVTFGMLVVLVRGYPPVHSDVMGRNRDIEDDA